VKFVINIEKYGKCISKAATQSAYNNHTSTHVHLAIYILKLKVHS